MKCHAGVEFPSGKPCPKCNAGLGDVCWPGINADLLEVVQLRKENERLLKGLREIAEDCYNDGGPTEPAKIAQRVIASVGSGGPK